MKMIYGSELYLFDTKQTYIMNPSSLPLRGAKYCVGDVTITSAFPLGMGNDFAGDAAEISVGEGALLVMVCPE